MRHECDGCPRTFRTKAKLDAHKAKEAGRPRSPRAGDRKGPGVVMSDDLGELLRALSLKMDVARRPAEDPVIPGMPPVPAEDRGEDP